MSLIGDIQRHLTQLLFVGAGVVSTKQELPAARHHSAQERLSATSVTAVSNAQGCCIWGNGGVHMSLVSLSVTFST
jgi:hypothetical protein